MGRTVTKSIAIIGEGETEWFKLRIYNQLLLNNLQLISQKYGRNF